jgi:type VI secretion system secreted protein VgrG
MSDTLRQDKRVGELNTPLGKDKLALIAFECSEGVSEKFEIKIDATSPKANLDFDDAIGQNCTITVKTTSGEDRHFCGALVETRWLGGDDKNLHYYQLVLRPWLWLLSARRNSFIHHDKTVPDIIAKVFGDHGFASFSNNLQRSYPKLEYCVQYRESDMDFVCRLMEEYGISYYFKHSDGDHKLIMTDETTSFESIPGQVRYFETAQARQPDKDYFRAFAPARSFSAGKIKLDDYFFEQSDADQVVNEDINPPFNPTLEVFDHPGRYENTGDGGKIAKAWRDMEHAKDKHFHGEGDCASCFPGGLLTMEDKSGSGLDGEYLALHCTHFFRSQSYRSRHHLGDGPVYEGRYEFIKGDAAYAPPRVTPKAIAHGPQTAKVIAEGGGGSEGDIDVDKYGRILVRFHWDQEPDQSRRVRVAQVWAGAKWGGIYTPRIGMEVVVTFLEGDPDQPLVIGTVYNDKHMPPYPLPDEKTKSGIKSNSTTSGSGFNEFIFDDKDGNQLVRLHAERNMEAVIEKDESRTVKNDRNTEIEQNDTLHVGQVLKITADTKIEITCGTTKIVMEPMKMSIETMSLSFKTNDFSTDAMMSSHKAAGVMDIKGGVVKINS